MLLLNFTRKPQTITAYSGRRTIDQLINKGRIIFDTAHIRYRYTQIVYNTNKAGHYTYLWRSSIGVK